MNHFLDTKLSLEQFPAVLRDDIDFLNKISSEVLTNIFLASFDVNSLYTNSPHNLAIADVTFWIDNHKELIDRKYKTELYTRYF